MPWEIGKTATPRSEFRAANILTDPTTITLKTRDPAGNESSYTHPATVTKDSTGVFHKDIALTSSGRWVFRWIGTGTVPTADEIAIDVEYSEFTTP